MVKDFMLRVRLNQVDLKYLRKAQELMGLDSMSQTIRALIRSTGQPSVILHNYIADADGNLVPAPWAAQSIGPSFTVTTGD